MVSLFIGWLIYVRVCYLLSFVNILFFRLWLVTLSACHDVEDADEVGNIDRTIAVDVGQGIEVAPRHQVQYADGIGGKGFYPSLPWLSKKYMYLPIPVAGIAMVIFELESLVNNVRRLLGMKVFVEKEATLEEQVAEGGNRG